MQTDKHNVHKYSDIPSLNEAWLSWLSTEAGRGVHQEEIDLMDEVLPKLRGYGLAVASLGDPQPLLGASKNSYQWWLKLHQCSEGAVTSAQIDPLQWPFEDGTLDVIVLHHSLDYAQWPHQTLREAVRCLSDSGHLVVIGFNPFSMWGIGRLLLGRWSQRFPWVCRFINPWRIADWLTMLDCRVTSAYYSRSLLPWSSGNWKRALQRRGLRLSLDDKRLTKGFWPGASYLLVCKPEIPSLTPIQKDWRRRQFTGIPLTERSYNFSPDEKPKSHS
jgi:SAM-dependent methyltransferase